MFQLVPRYGLPVFTRGRPRYRFIPAPSYRAPRDKKCDDTGREGARAQRGERDAARQVGSTPRGALAFPRGRREREERARRGRGRLDGEARVS
jgi:hypothetical protein